MKKTISILLALAMLLAALPLTAYAAQSATNDEPGPAETGVISDSGVTGGCKWSLYGSTLTISKDTGSNMENYDDSDEPPYYQYADKITSIVISTGVTDIGNNAFYGLKKAESLSLPLGLKVIGRYAFSHCGALKGVVIPNTVTKVGVGAFFMTGIETLSLSSNLTKISDYCFAGCPKLRSVMIPNSVTEIGDYAFCNDYLPEMTLSDPDDRYTYDSYLLESVTLSNNLERIGDCAFMHCYSLRSIALPDSLTALGVNAFDHCTALQSLTISKSLTEIPDYAFRECAALSYVDIPGNVKTIGESAFIGCGLYNVHLTDGIERIRDYAFYDTPMKAVMIPPSVTYVARHAFAKTHPGSYQIGNIIYHGEFGEEGYRVYGAPGTEAEQYANNLKMSFYDARYSAVSFYANGGYGTMDAIHVSEYEDYALPECTMTPPTGKEFSHWTAGSSGSRYNAGAACKIDRPITFYAQWQTEQTPTTVSSVTISGWPEAEAGQSAASNPPAGTCINRYYRLTDQAWYTVTRVSGQPPIYEAFNGIFEEGRDYVARYTVEPNKNAVFADSVTVNFADGSFQTCTPQRGGYLWVYVSVRAIAPQTRYVNSVALTITAPAAGAKPDYSVSKSSRSECDFYTTGLGFLVPDGTGLEFIDHSKGVPNNSPLTEVGYYMTANETFKAGGTYTARIFLTTASRGNTYFGKSFSAIINGARARVSDTSGGKETLVWVECTFTVPTGSGGNLLGDVDGNGKVDVFDASSIQKSIAGMKGYVNYGTLSKTDIRFKVADVDGNGKVDVFDASLIQKWIAGDSGARSYGIGQAV